MGLQPAKTSWTNRFAFEVALKLEGSGEDIHELLERHDYSSSDMVVFNADPTFLRTVQGYREDIREKGLTFKLKARAQAEELLTTSWLMIHSSEVSPAVKADLIKSTVKWGGLDQSGVATGDEGGGGVRITINLNPDNKPEPRVISGD